MPARFNQVVIEGITNSDLQRLLNEVNNYWKDMLRPSLTSFCCEAVGGSPDDANEISLMVTLIAAGMGIHDDIIDKSLSKHFRLTAVGTQGPDSALVAGDLLIVKALSAIRKIVRVNKLSQTDAIIAAYEAAFVEMCEGEFMEISCRKRLDIDLKDYNQILWKFGADTEVCARLGAIVGNGSNREIEVLSLFGRELGYMFRLIAEVKDCLNIEGNLPERLENESIPLPILFSAKSSPLRYSKIQKSLRKTNICSNDIEFLLELCFEADAFSYVKNLSEKNYREAIRILDELRTSEAQQALRQIAGHYFEEVEKLCT